METLSQIRTGQKLRYAKLLLKEIKDSPHCTTNNDWENAHQEGCFYHLVGVVDCLLHEINDGYSLELPLDEVKWSKVRSKLRQRSITSPAFDYLDALQKDDSSWLSLLIELRNHGAHRQRLFKEIRFSLYVGMPTPNTVPPNPDNAFLDPRTQKLQTVYPGIDGCTDVLDKLTEDVETLIDYCRSLDPNL